MYLSVEQAFTVSAPMTNNACPVAAGVIQSARARLYMTEVNYTVAGPPRLVL